MVSGVTGSELKAALASLGHTQVSAARALGIPIRTMHNWTGDLTPVPKWLERLLRLEKTDKWSGVIAALTNMV